MSIHFTQYLMPDGRQKDVTIERPEAVETLAKRVSARGGRFEIEMLSDYMMISLTCEPEDPEEETLAHELVPNGPDIPAAVDRLVAQAAVAMGVA
jgi:hypothetical protein